MELHAIYKPGELHLQTIVSDGICAYTDDKTVEEYLEELGDAFVCIPLEQALEQIHDIQEKTFIKPWEEISQEKWEYWLGVLPPQNWKTVDGVDFFQCPEYMIDDITLHCAGYKNRYFSAYRRVWTGYDVLAKEIKQLFGEEQL